MENRRQQLVAAPGHDKKEQVYVPTSAGRSFIIDVMPARYMFSVLSAVGFAIIYGLKVNLSVAIVTMVNHTAIGGAPALNSTASSASEEGPFEWNETLQGLILGSYFWGYLLGQLPGGRMSETYSAKWVMFAGTALNIVCTLLSPVACYLHYSAFVALRVLEGLGGGFTFPAMHVLIAHWAPLSERSVISAIIYAGTSLGTVVSLLMAGWIAGLMGWEWVFYLMGGLSIIWCFMWVWLVQDTPQKQPYISEEERTYIEQSLGEATVDHVKNPKVPWGQVFRSAPFYAILVSHTFSNVGWYMLLTQLPTFMKHVLKFQIKQNAVLSALPFFCMWLFSMALSKVLDVLRTKGKLSTGTARKISTGIAAIVPAGCLVAICFVGSSQAAGVALMTISIMCIGGMFCGFLSNHIDIASNFAGTLMAITNTIATIPGITVPVLVGYLTQGNQTIERWRFIFFGTSAIYIAHFLFYVIFASGEEQAWNKLPVDTNLEDDEPKKESKSV